MKITINRELREINANSIKEIKLDREMASFSESSSPEFEAEAPRTAMEDFFGF